MDVFVFVCAGEYVKNCEWCRVMLADFCGNAAFCLCDCDSVG